MGFELCPSSTANSHFRKTKVSGDGIIGGGVRAGPFLCYCEQIAATCFPDGLSPNPLSLWSDAVGIRDRFQLLEPPRQPFRLGSCFGQTTPSSLWTITVKG